MKKAFFFILLLAIASCKDKKEEVGPVNEPVYEIRQLTNHPEGVHWATISDDGSKIFYTVSGARISFGNFPVDLYSMNSDGSDQKKILTYPEATSFNIVISKNNQQLAFSASKNATTGNLTEIVIGNIDGTGLKTLLSGNASGYVRSFIENDQSLLYGRNYIVGNCSCNTIWKIKTDSSSNTMISGNGNAVARAVSLDRSLVLVDTYREAYSMDMNGQNIVQLGSNFIPWDISPDNSSIVMDKIMPWGNSSNTLQMFVSNASGTLNKQITNMEGTNLPHGFFPNGQEILFRYFKDGNKPDESELYSIKPDGSGLQRLTTNNIEERPIGFLEKTRKVLMIMSKDGVNNLFVLNLE